MKKKIEMYAIYETDDIEQARLVASANKNISVVYHSPNRKISPTLTLKINGHSFTKWNPEYIEYLKKKYPGISDAEIAKSIKKAMNEVLSEKEDLSKDNEIDANIISENVRKR